MKVIFKMLAFVVLFIGLVALGAWANRLNRDAIADEVIERLKDSRP